MLNISIICELQENFGLHISTQWNKVKTKQITEQVGTESYKILLVNIRMEDDVNFV